MIKRLKLAEPPVTAPATATQLVLHYLACCQHSLGLLNCTLYESYTVQLNRPKQSLTDTCWGPQYGYCGHTRKHI